MPYLSPQDLSLIAKVIIFLLAIWVWVRALSYSSPKGTNHNDDQSPDVHSPKTKTAAEAFTVDPRNINSKLGFHRLKTLIVIMFVTLLIVQFGLILTTGTSPFN
jgi:hypothetical protein